MLFGGLDGALQIVNGGQHGGDGLPHAVLVTVRAGGLIAALEVLEIRLGPKQLILEFVPLLDGQLQGGLPFGGGGLRGGFLLSGLGYDLGVHGAVVNLLHLLIVFRRLFVHGLILLSFFILVLVLFHGRACLTCILITHR